MHNKAALATAVLLITTAAYANTPLPATAGNSPVNFDIPRQSLAQALVKFSEQTALVVTASGEVLEGKNAPAINGTMPPEDALRKLLKGTGLKFVKGEAGDLAILKEETITTSLRGSEDASNAGALTLAQVPPAPGIGEGGGEAGKNGAEGDDKHNVERSYRKESTLLEEVVVTGTHITGVTSSASPVNVYTRDDIERTGLGTVHAFVERLPQNFNNASENSISAVAGNASTGNGNSATGVNLRGFGTDATLALINGRRIAPGGSNGNIADISIIPLAALEKIEVVTDGASAIYGADAVGGVVNFILRRDFDGAETRARYEAVSEGDSHQSQIGQTLGKTWARGSALLSYEYFDQSPLNAASRDYTQFVPQPFMLLPEQKRHSAFISLQQSLFSQSQVFADAALSRRSARQDVAGTGLIQRNKNEIDAMNFTMGIRVPLFGSSALELSSAYANSVDDGYSLANGVRTDENLDTDIWSVDAKLDGNLFAIPAGDISYAAGTQFRRESFASQTLAAGSTTTEFDNDRKVSAAYVELRIPLIAASETGGPQRLIMSLADRYEHYDDFGSTNNPQLGVIWQPLRGLKMRGTLGTSFKAPLLNQLNATPRQVVVLPVSDPSRGTRSCFPFGPTNSCTNSLIVSGGNPDLGPEKARTWTVGLDFDPQSVPGFRASATYYSVHFEDRILSPPSIGISFLQALNNEALLGSSIIRRDPGIQVAQQFSQLPPGIFINPFGIDLATIGAMIDYRLQNVSQVDSSGLDLNVSYRWPFLSGEIVTGIDGTYILEFDNKFTATAPTTEVVNSPYNPVDLRLRARFEFLRDNVSMAAFINYVDSYTDKRSSTSLLIASWTTIDVNARYRFAESAGFLSNLSFAIGLNNLANREPPFVASGTGFGINYDGTNANALGRTWFMQFSKVW